MTLLYVPLPVGPLRAPHPRRGLAAVVRCASCMRLKLAADVCPCEPEQQACPICGTDHLSDGLTLCFECRTEPRVCVLCGAGFRESCSTSTAERECLDCRYRVGPCDAEGCGETGFHHRNRDYMRCATHRLYHRKPPTRDCERCGGGFRAQSATERYCTYCRWQTALCPTPTCGLWIRVRRDSTRDRRRPCKTCLGPTPVPADCFKAETEELFDGIRATAEPGGELAVKLAVMDDDFDQRRLCGVCLELFDRGFGSRANYCVEHTPTPRACRACGTELHYGGDAYWYPLCWPCAFPRRAKLKRERAEARRRSAIENRVARFVATLEPRRRRFALRASLIFGNIDRSRIRQARVMAARAATDDPVSNARRREIASGRCVYCGCWGESADHVLPLSKGGMDTEDNLVSACQPCNSSKNQSLLIDWDERRVERASKVSFKVWAELHRQLFGDTALTPTVPPLRNKFTDVTRCRPTGTRPVAATVGFDL